MFSCNSNPKPPSQMKILLAGSDSFINHVLRQYVEQLSLKPPDWMNYIKFYIIPLGNGFKYLFLKYYVCKTNFRSIYVQV